MNTVQLPKTGQTTKYAAGDDGDLQKGAAWPSPRFAVSGDCVTDNLTGLLWSKNGDMPNGTKTWQGALDYVASLNSKGGLCGYTDWRLPNVNELESLVNAEESNTATWLNSQGFTNVQSYSYWSSSTRAGWRGDAWLVSMGDGGVNGDDKSCNCCVWPVRAGQSGSLGNSVIWKTGQTTKYAAGDDGDLQKGAAWPFPRFTNNGNKTVTDNLTGLIWTKDANAPGPGACSPGTKKTWQNALDYVACLNKNNYLGHNDWRLPNRKELFSLIDHSSKYNPAIPTGHPFINVQSDFYWSSSTFAYGTGSAWIVGVSSGYVSSGSVDGDGKSYYNYVWPVRAGTP